VRGKSIIVAAGLSALLALAGCAPSAEKATDQSAEAATCAARGGEMRPVGRLQSVQCVIRYADAGKPCTDGAQCQGACLASADARPAVGAAASGFCAADSNRFGCRTVIEHGQAKPTLCID